MADKKVDINKLKDEIDSRKKEKEVVSTKLGESQSNGNMPRDTFLNGLLSSLESGRETTATNRLKMVENAVSTKNGEGEKFRVNDSGSVAPPQPSHPTPNTNAGSGEDRDQLMYDQFKKKSQSLGESLSSYTNTPNGTAQPNYSPPQPQPQYPQSLNEQQMNEAVERIVERKLNDGLETIVETAMKNVVFEVYAAERMKETLDENKDTIKKVVYETLRELQNKKKKAQ